MSKSDATLERRKEFMISLDMIEPLNVGSAHLLRM
jgi:hypothetical protein